MWLDVCPPCRQGRITCTACDGKRQMDIPCRFCGGKGLVKSATRGDLGFLVNCRGCQGKGTRRGSCTHCSRSGWLSCPLCAGSSKKQAFRISVLKVYEPRRCDPCNGTGFPFPHVAVYCPHCLSTGIRAIPASDPTRTLE